MSTTMTPRRRLLGRTRTTTITSEVADPETALSESASDLADDLSVTQRPTQAQRTRRVATIIAASVVVAVIASSAATVLARRYSARHTATTPQS